MASFRPRFWSGLGLGVVLGAGGLAATQHFMHGEGGEAGSAVHGESGEAGHTGTMTDLPQAAGHGGEGESGAAHSVASVSPVDVPAFQMAVMRGHAKAGIALIEAGDAISASPLFLEPIAEIYEQEQAKFDKLGLTPDTKVYEALAEAAAGEAPAADLKAKIAPVTKDLDRLVAKAKGNPLVLTEALVDLVAAEYSAAVPGKTVENPLTYAEALGFALEARAVLIEATEPLKARDEVRLREAIKELEGLVSLWPSAKAPANPAPQGAVLAQISRVKLALAGLK